MREDHRNVTGSFDMGKELIEGHSGRKHLPGYIPFVSDWYINLNDGLKMYIGSEPESVSNYS